MPLSLDTRYAANTYATDASSATMSKEELQKLGYTVSDPSEDLGLDFTDFLQLMVAQLQNQTIDSAADTSDMLNQLVQMSVVQMMSSVKTSLDNLTDASTMTYAASLVGKTVTVGAYDDKECAGDRGNGHRDRYLSEYTGDLRQRPNVPLEQHYGSGDAAGSS